MMVSEFSILASISRSRICPALSREPTPSSDGPDRALEVRRREWAGMAQQTGAELAVLDDPPAARGIAGLRRQRRVHRIAGRGDHRDGQQQCRRISRTSPR
jgi:hypothetical protein